MRCKGFLRVVNESETVDVERRTLRAAVRAARGHKGVDICRYSQTNGFLGVSGLWRIENWKLVKYRWQKCGNPIKHPWGKHGGRWVRAYKSPSLRSRR